MATNHTENYNLNLWEPNDAFVREEFNENTSKIDAALACHQSAELIASVTVEEETGWLELDISGVDWDRYMMVAFIFDTEMEGEISLYTGENHEYCYSFLSNSTDKADKLAALHKVNHMTALFPVFYNGNRKPSVIGFGSGVSSAYCHFSAGGGQTPLNQCGPLFIYRVTERFLPGDKIELWGIK